MACRRCFDPLPLLSITVVLALLVGFCAGTASSEALQGTALFRNESMIETAAEYAIEAHSENSEEARKLRGMVRGVGSIGANCFPADARVTTSLMTNETMRMKDIRPGDKVVVFDAASGEWSLQEVLENALGRADVMAEHVTLVTSTGNVINATPDHFLFATPGTESGADQLLKFTEAARIVPAGSIQVGDLLWVRRPEASGPDALSPVSIASVGRSALRGMLNPVTQSGTLLVNAVLATTVTWGARERLPPVLDVYVTI